MIRRWWHRQVGHPNDHVTPCRIFLGWKCRSCDAYLGTALVSGPTRTRPRQGWPRKN